MRVRFGKTCTASGKWNVSRVIPRLYGWVFKTWRLFPLANEHSVAVMTCGFPIKTIPDCILWVANFRFTFYQICFQNQWEHKILRSQLRTLAPAVLVLLLSEWNTYLDFNSDIVNFVWKTNQEGGRSREHYLLIFVLWRCFTCRWVRGCWLGQKVLFRASWYLIFFQLGYKPTQ